jgi:hypothetical protein
LPEHHPPHALPLNTNPQNTLSPGIPAIIQSLAIIRHLLEMYRRQLCACPPRRKLERWANRLAKIAAEVQLVSAEK